MLEFLKDNLSLSSPLAQPSQSWGGERLGVDMKLEEKVVMSTMRNSWNEAMPALPLAMLLCILVALKRNVNRLAL